jgi:hypothetical protein
MLVQNVNKWKVWKHKYHAPLHQPGEPGNQNRADISKRQHGDQLMAAWQAGIYARTENNQVQRARDLEQPIDMNRDQALLKKTDREAPGSR